MRRLAALLLICLLAALTGCSPYQAFGERRQAEATLKQADTLVHGRMGQSMPSYRFGGRLYTDMQVEVLRGRNARAGQVITIRQAGGSERVPGTDQMRMEHVDFVYSLPAKGGEVFLLLREADGKYAILDAMPMRDGRPEHPSPRTQVYLKAYQALPAAP